MADPTVEEHAVTVPAFMYTGLLAAPTVADNAVAVPAFKYIGLDVDPTVAVPSLDAVLAFPDKLPVNVVA